MILLRAMVALGLVSTAPAYSQDGSRTLCDGAGAAIPLACAASSRGVALASDEARAGVILAIAEAGADRFVWSFRTAPPRFAVVESDEASLPPATVTALRELGFKTVLPWLSEKAYRAQSEQSVRRAVAQQMTGQPEARIDQVVRQVLDRQGASTSRGRIDSAAIPHELGHDWYRTTYWPDAPKSSERHYGSAGPDWLDEVAAVLMEPSTSVEDRRRLFAQRYEQYRRASETADETTRQMLDLPSFLQEAHPTAARVREFLDKNPVSPAVGGMSVRVITGGEAEQIAAQSGRFYQQAAVVALYLAERSGDPAIFGRIGAAFGRGETLQAWLARGEGSGKLPRDYAKLQEDWLRWLEQSFAPRYPSGATVRTGSAIS